MEIVTFTDEGLGHSSHLVDLGDGRAVLIDPARFPDAPLSEAAARGLEIAWTADTHTHADYVSGSPRLGADGATFLAPAEAGLEMPHQGLRHADLVPLGSSLSLRAVATPGHTPDHLAYLLLDGDRQVALFSGGSLMVGAVGRTDLMGPEHREALARQLFRALHEEILSLPDDLAVYPTHGAGSFCAAPTSGERTTTIGRERATNPLLAVAREDDFVELLLRDLGTFPTYFARLPEYNRTGPTLYREPPTLDRLGPREVAEAVDTGAVIIDTRGLEQFAEGHVPGSISNVLRPVFASWLGWVVDVDRPLIFVRRADQSADEIVRQCLTIGHESLVGELAGGVDAWRSEGRALAAVALVDPQQLRGPVLDVRQETEWAAGHLPRARHLELGSLDPERVPEGPVTVMCGHGERAATAASLLLAAGRNEISVLAGGPDDWANATGGVLERGP